MDSGGQGKPDTYFHRGALGLDLAAVGFDQLLDDGKADARPAMLPGARLFTPVEAFEDEGNILFRDPLTGVGKDQLDPSGQAFGGDPDVLGSSLTLNATATSSG